MPRWFMQEKAINDELFELFELFELDLLSNQHRHADLLASTHLESFLL